MAKRSFLQLAHTYNAKKHEIMGWYVSEKLDGMRAYWDGGITRGTLCENVLWANTERDNRYKEKPVATGLWTRYGKAIQAPDWFLDKLPEKVSLDGELWLDHGLFQKLVSIVKSTVTETNWENIRYKVFDNPPYCKVFADGKINETNYKKTFTNILEFVPDDRDRWSENFSTRLTRLKNMKWEEYVHPHNQYKVTHKAFLEGFMESIIAQGGEGVILKSPYNIWMPERTHEMVKMKPKLDAEAIVIGYRWGDLPDNSRTVGGNANGKLLGKMGSLIVNFNNVTFNLSGFTDEERILVFKDGSSAFDDGCKHPGEIVDSCIHNHNFPRGSKITFSYRELSKDGIPKEAHYLRKYVT